MPYIVSLQGGMASGKTTLARQIQRQRPDINVSYEDISNPATKVKRLGLDKFVMEDYFKIQRIFIAAEIQRFNNLKGQEKVVIDLGPEEMEFYTLHFPKAIGQDWDVQGNLKNELRQLRECKLDTILFLEANDQHLVARRQNDKSRNRSFFDFYLSKLHQYKVDWFRERTNVKFIDTNGSAMHQVADLTLNWLDTLG